MTPPRCFDVVFNGVVSIPDLISPKVAHLVDHVATELTKDNTKLIGGVKANNARPATT